MAIQTTKFLRKPLYVDAVRINDRNFDEIVAWCQGEVQQDDGPQGKKYIKVRVHNPKNPRQTKAYVGDWLLYTERGYKVYTNKAFHASFDKAQVASREELEQAFGKQERPETAPTELVSTPTAIVDHDPEGDYVREHTPSPVTDITEVKAQKQEALSTDDTRADFVPDHHELMPPIPEDVAQAIRDNEAARAAEAQRLATTARETVQQGTQTVEDVPDQEPVQPSAVEGRRVLSVEEQRAMTQDEIRELVQSGEAVLAQDIAQP